MRGLESIIAMNERAARINAAATDASERAINEAIAHEAVADLAIDLDDQMAGLLYGDLRSWVQHIRHTASTKAEALRAKARREREAA